MFACYNASCGGGQADLAVILQAALIHFVVLPKLLDLGLSLYRISSHIEARLRQVHSILVWACDHNTGVLSTACSMKLI